jgi:hypothetical protein
VGVKHAPIIQVNQLMLSAATHSRDAVAAHGPPLGGRDASTKRRMVDVERNDASTHDESTQVANSALDFR